MKILSNIDIVMTLTKLSALENLSQNFISDL